MNLESAPAAPAADAERPEAPGPVPAPPERPHPPRLAPGVLLAWGLAALALVVVALLWQKVSSMQEQLARQSAEASSRSVEARTLARQADTDVRDALGKLAALDGRVSDLAAYRAQMEELVQSVARARDENLAVDLESAVRVAQDQAQLTGSVQPLLAALRTAERRLARSSDPRLAPVARAVARDLERVKNANLADTAGLLARIDQLLREVDELPMANAVGPQRSGGAGRERAASPAPAPAPSWWERLGRSISLLADEQGVLALLVVADAVKLSSRQAIQELRALGITTVMLTGDNLASAQAIARETGISDVQAELLPQQKLEVVQALNASNGNVSGMVGDGINDAPALAAALVGFAMGQGGTHIATEAADVVIMNDDLRRVAETVRLSKYAHGVLWQNIMLALGIKTAFLLLAMLGHATMWMAVFADVGASLLVVCNGLRMLRWRG